MRQFRLDGYTALSPSSSWRTDVFEFTTYRLYWPRCKVRAVEHIPFLSHPHAGMTKALERTIFELRQHMSIRAVANYFHLRWHSVKELEKLMNDKLDKVRRRVTAGRDINMQKQLMRLRFIFLMNREDLPEEAKLLLNNMRGNFQELGDAYMFKEARRMIYMRAKKSCHANIAFHRRVKLAEETGIPELKSRALTIRDKLDGIISLWNQ